MSNNRNRNRHRSQSQQGQTARELTTGSDYIFHHKGQRYTIPPASQALKTMPAGEFVDAVMDDTGAGETRLGIAMLHAVNPDPAAMAALRSMTIEEFGQVVGDWMKRTGANPGESERSSNS